MGAPSIKYHDPEQGQSKEGFDCSGLVRYVLQQAGLIIPNYIGMDGRERPIRHSNEFWDSYGIAIHPDKYQAGDLLFFSRNGQLPTHIGIVRDEESYIHAPGKENTVVTVSAIAKQAIRQAGMTAGPYSVNPIGFKSPVVPIPTPTTRYHQALA